MTTEDVAPQVVAIGASAGGLEALTGLFRPITPLNRFAFVIVQHLSPHFKSVMQEILTKKTALKVVLAEDGMRPEVDTIYLNRPQCDLEIRNGRFVLTRWDKPGPSSTLHFPIDVLFQSLAADVGEKAIGVVLSGTGSDGSRGLAAIHGVGGLTVVQEPGTALFEGMPDAALRATNCNLVLPPEEMGAALVRYLDHPSMAAVTEDTRPERNRAMEGIRAVLEKSHQLYLSLYKEPTVQRRIAHRLSVLNISSITDYLEVLRTNPAEQEALYADLLIGVTRFFRDIEAFAMLKVALAQAVAVRPDRPFRVWIPACATGEEAYSIAMMLHEMIDASRVKVFATDLHESSIRVASQGFYSENALVDVSIARRTRFFEPASGGFRVRKELRDSVVFATHDLLADPPFSGIDLVSCRNLLIYFNNDGQHQAITRLVFALRVGGLLLMGPSESPGRHKASLDVVNAHWKLYRKHSSGPSLRNSADLFQKKYLEPQAAEPPNRRLFPSQLRSKLPSVTPLAAYDVLLEEYAPPGLLIDQERRLLHTFGEGRKLLQPRVGRPSSDVVELVREDLRAAISTALQCAMEEPSETVIEVDSTLTAERVRVRPIPLLNGLTHYLVSVGEAPTPAEPPSVLIEVDQHWQASLEQKLSWTRHLLQEATESAVTANEELQATNEELVAANEELQATNEELHSVNEELRTVNSEFRAQNQELQQTTADLENLLRSTEIGVIFLDEELCVRRFTEQAAKLFHLRPGDEGRPLKDLATTPAHLSTLEMARAVLRGESAPNKELSFPNSRHMLLQVRPYLESRTRRGAVLSFVDISDLEEARASLLMQGTVLDIMEHGVGIWQLEDLSDPGSFRFIFANPASDRISGLDSSVLLGLTAREASPDALEAGVFEKYRQVLLTGEPRTDELHYSDPRSRPYVVRQVATRGPNNTVVIVFEDISEDIIRRQEAEAARRLQSIGEVSGSIAHDLNNLLSVIMLNLHGGGGDLAAEDIQATQDAANRAADLVSQLLAYSKRRPVSPRAINVADLTMRIRPMLKTVLGPIHPLHVHAEPSLPSVRMDPSALEQVLINLATNARNALLGREGEVSVLVSKELDESGTPWVQLKFSDNGPGMTPEVLARCLEPFFTTQPKGLGSGLGLSSALGVVEQAGGTLQVLSAPEQGATFIIRLPASSEASEPIAAPAEEPWRGQGQRLLLVDDEEILCRTTGRRLEDLGFVVSCVFSAADALDWIAQNGAPELLLTDVLMPEMNGPTLADEVRAAHPELPVLFMSGYPDHASVRSSTWEMNTHNFIEKPFSIQQLSRALERLLGGD